MFSISGKRILVQSLVLSMLLGHVKSVFAQKIVDPCFTSISPLGRFNNSADIINLCRCPNNFIASDLIEWNGTQWLGTLTEYIDLPPPPGCNVRGMWMGYNYWTGGGEAFAMRLDKPLEENKTYTFTFTYAKDGHGDLNEIEAEEFSPWVWSHRSDVYPSLQRANRVGRLPNTGDYWTTGSITFKAKTAQHGDGWIILHALESSGTILSNCIVTEAIEKDFLVSDTTLCFGDSLVLQAAFNERYAYTWNTGEITPSITVRSPGEYSVVIDNYNCESFNSVEVSFDDCEVRFAMPNVFTPNGDQYNRIFSPMEHNYIESGTIMIIDRWGERVFSGDLFEGWDGRSGNALSASGVYFYKINFIDKNGMQHSKNGPVTLIR